MVTLCNFVVLVVVVGFWLVVWCLLGYECCGGLLLVVCCGTLLWCLLRCLLLLVLFVVGCVGVIVLRVACLLLLCYFACLDIWWLFSVAVYFVVGDLMVICAANGFVVVVWFADVCG